MRLTINTILTSGDVLSRAEGVYSWSFFISNFRRVLNVLCFLLGNSPALKFYMQTFRNTQSVPSSSADTYGEWLCLRMLELLYGKRFGSKLARANRKEGDRVGAGHLFV